MTIGVILLVHADLGRAARVARIWAAQGCAVAVHVDARVPRGAFDGVRAMLAGESRIGFTRRFACEWGTWGIVAATQAAAHTLLADPAVRHVYLASGSCLPLRPAAELAAHLADHPDTDFIESVTAADVGWTVAGLNEERFTLRFPFAWRRRRWLFDRTVELQRRLRLCRRPPEGIAPHLGAQWWCLTRRTLDAILTDPRRAEFDRYFRQVWIPDESYFQTLARRHARRIESRSLTLARFDSSGRPHLFHDDHAALLRQSNCFVARKIWPGAERLYAEFPAPASRPGPPDPDRIDRLFARAEAERQRGRPGLYNQARFPRKDAENGKTAAPYAVLQGVADLFPEIGPWLARATGFTVHGRLFHPGRVEFANGDAAAPGGLSDSAALRDHDRRAFLTNLVWAARDQRQVFMARPGETADLTWFMATDPNARILIVPGAWILALSRAPRPFAELRSRAVALQKAEDAQLAILTSPHARARVRTWPLAEALDAPEGLLAGLLGEVAALPPGPMAPPPRLADVSGLPDLLRRLRDSGLRPPVSADALRAFSEAAARVPARAAR